MKVVDIKISNLPEAAVNLIYKRITNNISVLSPMELKEFGDDNIILKQYNFQPINFIGKCADGILCEITDIGVLTLVYDAIKQNSIVQDNHGAICFTYFNHDESFIDSEKKKIENDFKGISSSTSYVDDMPIVCTAYSSY